MNKFGVAICSIDLTLHNFTVNNLNNFTVFVKINSGFNNQVC